MPFSSCFHMHTQIIHIIICYLCHATVNLKNAQCEDFKLSFIWGKMSIAAQETAPHIALRNCSKEVRGRDSIYVILVKGGVQACRHIFFVESFCWSHEASATHEKQSSA